MEDLVSRIASGDEDALKTLYEQNAAQIFSYLLGQLNDDRLLAEEVLQDIMVAVWRGAARFRADSSPRTWLFSIVRHHTINAIQRRKPNPLPLDNPDNLPAANPIEQHEQIENLRSALRKLNDKHREVLEFIFFHGFSYAETATVLNIPIGTVRSRLNRAKTALHRLLVQEKT